MAKPTFQAAGSLTGNTTSISVAWPTHQAGDLGLLIVESAADPGAISGWTQIAAVSPAAGSYLSVYWKRAASGAESNVTVPDTGDHQMGAIVTVRGAKATGDPIAGYTTGTGTWPGSSGGEFVESASATAPNYLEMLGVSVHSRDNDSAASSFSTGYFVAGGINQSTTEVIDTGSISGDGGGIACAVCTGNVPPGAAYYSSAGSNAAIAANVATMAILILPENSSRFFLLF